MHKYLFMSGDVVSTGSPGAGATGDCELPEWLPGTKLRSSARVVHISNHRAISPSHLPFKKSLTCVLNSDLLQSTNRM